MTNLKGQRTNPGEVFIMVVGFARIGWTEVLLILAIIVLVFGTSRFGQLKKSAAKAVKNFTKEAKGGAED